MTLEQYLATRQRTYNRATRLQIQMTNLANASTDPRHALQLKACGERVWVIADRYLSTLAIGVQK